MNEGWINLPPGVVPVELIDLIKFWKGNDERRQCTLPQIVELYCLTHPGRISKLIVEMAKRFDLPDEL